jgi:hypothetical protein
MGIYAGVRDQKEKRAERVRCSFAFAARNRQAAGAPASASPRKSVKHPAILAIGAVEQMKTGIRTVTAKANFMSALSLEKNLGSCLAPVLHSKLLINKFYIIYNLIDQRLIYHLFDTSGR